MRTDGGRGIGTPSLLLLLAGGAAAAVALPAPTAAATLADAGSGAEAQGAPTAQDVSERLAGSAIAISSRPGGRAELELVLRDGSEHVISFSDGAALVDGERLGPYEPGGALETAWRDLLRRHAGTDPAGLSEALLAWEAPAATGPDARTADALRERIRVLLGVRPQVAEAPETTTVTGPGGARLSIAPGGLSFEALARRLESLETALAGLGEAAEGAEERLALIVHDDYAIAEGQVVDGNLALVGGDLRLGGVVRGDVLVLDGTLVLEPSARVEGDLLQVGGEVEESGGRVAGEILSLRGGAAVAPETPRAARAPDAPRPRTTVRPQRRDRGFFGSVARNVGNAVEGVGGVLSAFIGLGLLGLLAVLLARPQLETVADTARYAFPRSLAIGVAAEILFLPVVVVLAVTVIGIPVAVLLIPATALGILAGYLAAAHATGEIFARRRYRTEWIERLRRSNSYYYVLTGLALLLLPFLASALLWLFGGLGGFLRGLLVFAGVLTTWLAATAGFGALLLTRGGTRKEWSRDAWRAEGEPAGWAAPGATSETAPDA